MPRYKNIFLTNAFDDWIYRKPEPRNFPNMANFLVRDWIFFFSKILREGTTIVHLKIQRKGRLFFYIGLMKKIIISNVYYLAWFACNAIWGSNLCFNLGFFSTPRKLSDDWPHDLIPWEAKLFYIFQVCLWLYTFARFLFFFFEGYLLGFKGHDLYLAFFLAPSIPRIIPSTDSWRWYDESNFLLNSLSSCYRSSLQVIFKTFVIKLFC